MRVRLVRGCVGIRRVQTGVKARLLEVEEGRKEETSRKGTQ